MRTLSRRPAALLVTAVLATSGCGLELIGNNIGHTDFPRPASTLLGGVALSDTATVVVSDADGKALEPFASFHHDGLYGLRLPSSKYSNLVLSSTEGSTTLRCLVPSIGEESLVELDIDARSTTEALITEARLSADKSTWKQVTPDVYVATRELMRQAFDTPGPTQELLQMVTHIFEKYDDPQLGSDPLFFHTPKLDESFHTVESAIDKDWVTRSLPDLDGDGRPEFSTAKFDDKLAAVAQLYRPAGCPDPDKIRIVFTVDFNPGRKNGNCGVSDRFKWATDKPGKSMYFVGWIHKDSPIQDPLVQSELGAGVPNQLPMKDDGTGGDETAGDNIWTIAFDVPRNLRIGYKYTWGTRGAPWTGSEEWPGNSRIIEVVDVNGDDLVYRRDVFGDEATNKDRSNLYTGGDGILDWDENLRGYGIEAREMMVDTNQDCIPDTWLELKAIGPLTVPCTQ